LSKHLEWSKNNPEKRAAAVAKLLSIYPAVALDVEKRRPTVLRTLGKDLIDNNQDIADTFFAQKVIPKPVKVDSTFAPEFNKYIGQ
jgi:sulfonate transport system substrate-binding protein